MAPGRNELCHCGLPKKCKHCCMSLDEGQANRVGMVRSANTLFEKNLTLIAGAADIFNLNKDWDKVKSGMSDARIREFYKFIAGLWPVDTDYLSLLPKPDSSLRALYLGENDPEMMLQNVFPVQPIRRSDHSRKSIRQSEPSGGAVQPDYESWGMARSNAEARLSPPNTRSMDSSWSGNTDT